MRFSFIFAMIIAYLFGNMPAYSDEIRLHSEGNGWLSTRPFTVDGPWEVRWQTHEHITISVHDMAGEQVDVAALLVSGNGFSYEPVGGKFFLKVQCLGPWRLDVISLSQDK